MQGREAACRRSLQIAQAASTYREDMPMAERARHIVD
jgi:hypothetical protein